MAKNAWIFSYKLKKNVNKEQFVELTEKLHDEVISKAKGFISWEHYLQKDIWTDFVLWETEEDANNAALIGKRKGSNRKFLRMHSNEYMQSADFTACKKILTLIRKKTYILFIVSIIKYFFCHCYFT